MSEFVIRVQQHEPRHTYTEGKVHRDNKGRFASVGAAGVAVAGAGAATMYGDITHAAHGILQQNRREGDATAAHFMDAARTGDKPRADKLAQRLKSLEGESDYLIAARQKAALIAAGGAAVGLAGLYAHSRANRRVGRNEMPRPVSKSVRQRVGQKLDNLHITGEQARNAGVMGQIGAGTGVITGAAIGAGVGAAAHHAAQGAGIGGAIGGALGGSAGAGAGLYAGRPSNARRRKKLVGTAPTTLAKSFDGKKRGAVIGAGAGMATGQLIGVGARSAAQRARTEQGLTDHLADYKAAGAKAKMLDATGDFHRSPKGVGAMAVGGALTGAALVRHHQRKIAAQVDPIAKSAKKNTAVAGLGVGSAAAGAAAIKPAKAAGLHHTEAQDWHAEGAERAKWAGKHGKEAAINHRLSWANYRFAEGAAADPTSAHRERHYRSYAEDFGRGSGYIAGEARKMNGKAQEAFGYARKHRALATKNTRVAVALGGASLASAAGAAALHRHKSPVAKMSDETKTKLARGGLIGAQLADVAAIKSAYHETTTATKTGTGLGSALSYGAKKAALPIVAGGLVASVGAERVMHAQQKKLKAAQALKTPSPTQVKRTTNP